MKKYRVVVTPEVKEDLKRYAGYLKTVKKNPIAAKMVLADFIATKEELFRVAGTIQEASSDILRSQGLKRINFQKHDYFLLFKINNDLAIITNMFHASENYEYKLN